MDENHPVDVINYKPLILHFLDKFRIPTSDLDDLVQETYVRALRNYNGGYSSKYIEVVTTCVSIDYLRRKKRDGNKHEKFEEEINQNLHCAIRTENMEIFRRQELLEEVLSKQNKKTQEIINARIEGHSFKEISKTVGCNENTAKVKFFRFKASVKKECGVRKVGKENTCS